MARKPTVQELRKFEASGGDMALARKYIQSGGDIETGLRAVGNAKGPASWYDGGSWSSQDAMLNGAYWVMFGREIDPSGLAEFRKTDWAGSDLLFTLSGSSEFTSRGGNAAAFGNTEVDLATLTAEERAYYDVWRVNNPDKPFLESDRQYLQWSMGAGSIEAFQADQDGLVKHETWLTADGEPVNFSVVTQEAVDAMGGDLTGIYGNREGDLFYAPTGLSTNKQTVTGDEITGGEYSGYSAYSTIGHQSSGLGDFTEDITGSSELGDAVSHVGDAAASGGVYPYALGLALQAAGIDEGAALIDPLNIATPIFGGELAGRKHVEDTIKAGEAFGLSPQDTVELQSYAKTGTAVVLSVVAPYAGAAFISADSAATAQMDYLDWGDAAIRSAAAFATAGVQSNAATPAGAAAGYAGISAASTYAMGGDFADAGEAAAWSFAGSLTGHYLGGAAAAAGLDGLYGEIGAAAVNAAVLGEAREALDSDYTFGSDEFRNALFQGVLAKSVRRPGGAKTEGTFNVGESLFDFTTPERRPLGAQ